MKLAGKILFVFFIMLPAMSVYGQKKGTEKVEKRISPMTDNKPYYLSLDIKKKDRIAVSNFSRIVFADGRTDTTYVGSVVIDLRTGVQKLAFPEAIKTYMNKKLNNAIIPDSFQNTLYIKLRDLWFNETITQAGWMEGALMGNEKIVSNCFFNAEIFISGNNKVKRLGILDTLFTKKRWLPDNGDDLLTKAFTTAILLGDRLAADTGEEIPEEQFDYLFSSAYMPPVLKDGKLAKGIYFSYKDFLDNKPDELPFNIIEKESKYFLTYKQAADTTSDKAWGYCDGESIYMHLDKAYYKMERVNNSFLVLAPETIEIINMFTSKVVAGTMWYFVFENPFKLFAIEPFLNPKVKRETSRRWFRLNILNGTLR